MRSIFYVILLLPLCFSCKSRQEKGVERVGIERAELNVVDTIHLRRGNFEKELLSNGKLHAAKKGILRFAQEGVLNQINYKNGDRVQQGAVIAALDDSRYRYELAQHEKQLEKAAIDRDDALIGFGFRVDDTEIPEETRRIADVRSGYSSAGFQVETARINLRNCSLTAPFSGKIASLTNNVYENPKNPFCVLLDDSSFNVDFPILESEIGFVKVGQRAYVSPLHNPSARYEAKITEINPIVDKNGQISVRASVKNSDGLMDGMNVKVFVTSNIPNMLVVPKSAVLIRDNYEVVFRLDEERQSAIWNYVTVVASNSHSHAITGNHEKNTEINPGDVIIISGNLNLAQDSKVEIR